MSRSLKSEYAWQLTLLTVLLLCGCSSSGNSVTVPPTASSNSGKVYSGQQPISGAIIQLYAAGSTGDGSAATPLLSSTVTTNATGAFSITGLYTCPTPTSLVYLQASGGNPGLTAGTNNTAIALIASLGQCQTLSTSTYVAINEVTTVAAVAALAPYATSPTAIGSSTAHSAALASAFALAAEYASTTTGSAPGSGAPAGYSVPAQQINTLANLLAGCVNSAGGSAGDGSNCGNLFSYSSYGIAPGNVFYALLNILSNPSSNLVALLNLASSMTPYQPALSAPPPNWSVALTTANPTLTVSPALLSFASTSVGSTSASQAITLSNTGSPPITGGTITLTGADSGDFSISGSSCTSTLAAGGVCTIALAFSPIASGARYADIAIASSASVTPIYVPLSGTGSGSPVPGSCTNPTTVYFVDPSGSDSNSGLSASSPWQTIAKVNAASLAPCSAIYFKAGGTWRGGRTAQGILFPQSGSSTNGPITYGSYGAGPAPIILGSVNEAGTPSWGNVASYAATLWRSASPILTSSSSALDIGNLIFIDANGNNAAGFKKYFTGAASPSVLAGILMTQGDFWCDPNTGYLWMYSSANPGAYYNNIEAATGQDIIYLNGIHDVVVENLNLMFGGKNGINAVNSYNLTFQYLQISWIGGTVWGGHAPPIWRLGNGIQLWASASNVLIQGNKIWEIYDTALTNQANSTTSSAVQANITYVNNLIYNTPYNAVDIMDYGTGTSTISNVKYIQNTSINPGSGWSASQRPDAKGEHVGLETLSGQPSNVVIENNIYYGGYTGAWVQNTSAGKWNSASLLMDYNDYYQTGTSIQPFSNWSQWTNYSGNIWYVIMASSYAGMTLNGSACNVKSSEASLVAQGDCFWDTATGNLYLYSTTNPGLAYSSILATINNVAIVLVDVLQLYSSTQLASYRSYFGMDAHSFSANPLFVSATPPFDAHLTSISPARSAGTYLGVAVDMDQKLRPVSGPQDIGAYAY